MLVKNVTQYLIGVNKKKLYPGIEVDLTDAEIALVTIKELIDNKSLVLVGKTEAPKVEAPKVEPVKVEAPKVEHKKFDKPARFETKPEPKVEVKPEPKLEVKEEIKE